MFQGLFLKLEEELEDEAAFSTAGGDDDGADADRAGGGRGRGGGGSQWEASNPRFSVSIGKRQPPRRQLQPRISNLTAPPRTQAELEADALGNTRPPARGPSPAYSGALAPIADDAEETAAPGRVISQELLRARFRIASQAAISNDNAAAPADAPADAPATAAATPTISNSDHSPEPNFQQRKLPDIRPRVNLHLVSMDIEPPLISPRAHWLAPVLARQSARPGDTATTTEDDGGSLDSFTHVARAPGTASRQSLDDGSDDDDDDAAAAPPPPSLSTSSPRFRPPPVVTATRSRAQSMPTHNPFVARLLAAFEERGESPFRVTAHLDAESLSRDLETKVYFTPQCLARMARFRPRVDDVIVTGVPRSGLSPVLRILDALRRGVPPASQFSFEAREALADAASWIEHEPMLNLASPISAGGGAARGRLLRTHMPLVAALHGEPCPRGVRPMWKAVVVLRDPCDVRVSWFRHLRRSFKHFHPDEAARFDYALKLDDFARLPAPRASSILDGQFPEDAIAEALRYLSSPQVCIVLYEELLIDARSVVERLARFSGWGGEDERLRDEIARGLEDDATAHPKWGLKKGSSGAGLLHLSPAAQRFIDDVWFRRVRLAQQHMRSYDAVYRDLTGQVYPLPVRPPLARKRMSRGANKSGGSGGILRGLSGLMGGSSRRGSADDSDPQLGGVDPDDRGVDAAAASSQQPSQQPPQRRGSLLGMFVSKHDG